jgi:hypothetical protein
MINKSSPPTVEQAMMTTELNSVHCAETPVPWWLRRKDQQKADIETAVREFLVLDRDLTDREIYFLAEALAAVARGTFGIAMQAIIDAHEPESAFSPYSKIPPEDFKGTTMEALRKALQHSESCPVQETPVFR